MRYNSPAPPMFNRAKGALASALHRWSARRVCFISKSTAGQDVSADARLSSVCARRSAKPSVASKCSRRNLLERRRGCFQTERTRPAGPRGPAPLLRCACGGYCWTKESILCISGARAEVPGPSLWPRGGCAAAVIWSVSCGILIESEAFQINPETSGLPAGATSKSEGRRMVTFTQRILERAETPRGSPFSVPSAPFAGSPGRADREPDPDWTPGHIWMQFPLYSSFNSFSLRERGRI